MYPIFIRIGDYAIRWYGVIIAIAVVFGIFYSRKELMKIGVDEDTFFDYAIWVIIVGVIGARLLYVFGNTPLYYLTHPLRILYIWEGGLSYLGIIIAGLIFSYYFWKKRGNIFHKVTDIASVPLAFGWAIGRIGCFLNGCCYGKPTGLPFPFSITFTNPESFAPLGIPLYPTQPLLSITGFITLFIILKYKNKIKVDGGIFTLFLILYSIFTFLIEFLRGDHYQIFGLTASQWGSFLIVIFAYLFYKSSPSLKHEKEKAETSDSNLSEKFQDDLKENKEDAEN